MSNEIPKHIKNLSIKERALLAQRLLKEKKKSSGTQITPIKRDSDTFPVSFAQQRLWFLDQLIPGSSFYNIPFGIRMDGPLDIDALDKSINEIVRRHETLRTTFKTVDGEPRQVIHQTQRIELQVLKIEVNSEEGAEMESSLKRFGITEASKPFDLSTGPLVRMTLLALDKDVHILLVVMHHILSDEWSINVFMRELTILYQAFSAGETPSLPDLPIQYVDFSHWQRVWLKGERLEEQISYWKEALTNLPVLVLPTDRPRPPVRSFHGANYHFILSKDLVASLQAISNSEGSTLFMTLLAAFQILLYRYTGQEDIPVGIPLANRNIIETEGLIGFFINTLVMRTDLSGNPDFLALLRRVRKVALGAYSHQELPFEKLVEELHPERSLSQNPLFQVTFQLLQGQHDKNTGSSKLRFSPVGITNETVRFDLELQLKESADGIVVAFAYNTDLFDESTIVRIAGHLQRLIESIVKDPNIPISDIEMLTETERRQILFQWNDTSTDYPRDITVHRLFESQAERTPDSVAVVFEEKRLTYRELNQMANQLAHYLQKLGVGPEVLVGICAERSIEMVVGLLSILKAGGAYVPLDHSYPTERLEFMMRETQAPVLLTHRGLLSGFSGYKGRFVQLDADWEEINRENMENPVSGTTAENIAYVMYTSGSTGKPKGVSIVHRSIVRLVKNTNYARMTEEEVFLQMAPVSFDASTLELWGPLLNGGRLVVMPPGTPSLEELGETLKRYGINTLWLTAGLFHLMADERADDLKHLRQLLAGGDVLSLSHVRRILRNMENGSLINGYGPTENTTFTCCYSMQHPGDLAESLISVPIGKPISNTMVYILDSNLNPVPAGVPGELYIGGDGLARDYFKSPELTAEKFIPNPYGEKGSRLYRTGDMVRYLSDGNIEFFGRIDHQVKIRGFRIELGEIEVMLKQHHGVQDVVVVVREDQPGEKRLVSYVVGAGNATLPPSELHHFLSDKLPSYMVPSSFVQLDRLPLTPNGKVDRRALPEPDRIRPGLESVYMPPRSELEKRIADVWKEVLSIDAPGINDNFFELGGNSLLMVRARSQLCKVLGKEISMVEMFESPTIGSLATRLTQNEPSETFQEIQSQAQKQKDAIEKQKQRIKETSDKQRGREEE